jgi:NarL family two-component system response regulator LiaR
MSAIRVLVCDDHAVVREGLRTFVNGEPGMLVVGEAGDGLEAVAQARVLQPDVILLDLVMPRQDGPAAIAAILNERPAARVLVLTSFADDALVMAAIKAGALGYLLKDSAPDELIAAIRAVARGEPTLPPTIALKLFRELKQPAEPAPAVRPLTEREVEVLRLVARGLTNRTIAERLQISEWTVRTHVRNILDKLQLANRTEAVLYALREGLATLSDT